MKYLNGHEQERFLASARSISDKHYFAARFLLETGLRASELIPLRVKDVYGKRSFMARTLKQRCRYNCGPRKGQKIPVYREIPLRQLTIEYITKRYERSNPDDYLLPSQKGGHISYKRLYAMIYDVMKSADLDYNLHSLRHTFAMNLKDTDCYIIIIKDLMGHSKLDSTSCYLHANREEKFLAVNSMKVKI